MVPIGIGRMARRVEVMREQVKKILINHDVCRDIIRMAAIKSESILRKIITKTVTED